MVWEGLISLYDKEKEMCPISHTYITAHIGVLLDMDGKFLCAKDVSAVRELVPVPCTVESESRTSGAAPHLISDNLAYVCRYPKYENRYDLYIKQLAKYVKNVPADAYADAVYQYTSKNALLHDIRDLLDMDWHLPKHKINIIFAVYGLKHEGRDYLWPRYYTNALPKNGHCSITGELDYIPDAYPAGILSSGGQDRLFLVGCGVGYIASQKICHAIQWMAYAKDNKRKAMLNAILKDGDGPVVKNKNGVEIRSIAAVALMDDDIREAVHFDLAPCSDQEFFDEYAKRHAKKYGEDWIIEQVRL